MLVLGGALSVTECLRLAKSATRLALRVMSLRCFLKTEFPCMTLGLGPAVVCSMGALVRREMGLLSHPHRKGLPASVKLGGGGRLGASPGVRARAAVALLSTMRLLCGGLLGQSIARPGRPKERARSLFPLGGCEAWGS